MSDEGGGKVGVAAIGGLLALFGGGAAMCGKAAMFCDDAARVASHGDDLARLGGSGDDLARLGGSGDDLARLGGAGDDLARVRLGSGDGLLGAGAHGAELGPASTWDDLAIDVTVEVAWNAPDLLLDVADGEDDEETEGEGTDDASFAAVAVALVPVDAAGSASDRGLRASLASAGVDPIESVLAFGEALGRGSLLAVAARAGRSADSLAAPDGTPIAIVPMLGRCAAEDVSCVLLVCTDASTTCLQEAARVAATALVAEDDESAVRAILARRDRASPAAGPIDVYRNLVDASGHAHIARSPAP